MCWLDSCLLTKSEHFSYGSKSQYLKRVLGSVQHALSCYLACFGPLAPCCHLPSLKPDGLCIMQFQSSMQGHMSCNASYLLFISDIWEALLRYTVCTCTPSGVMSDPGSSCAFDLLDAAMRDPFLQQAFRQLDQRHLYGIIARVCSS